MIIEREMIISILKLTKNGIIEQENVNKEAKIPKSIGQKLLQKLQYDKLIYIKGDMVHVDTTNRLKLAVRAAELGADIERLSRLLAWKEFENLIAIALVQNGYEATENVRFKHALRRWEIDVVGCRKPFVLCIDCKQWRNGISPAKLEKIVADQLIRVQALVDALPNRAIRLPATKWEHAKFFPIVLSLVPNRFKFWSDVPLVPVLQFQEFINQMPLYASSLKCFSKRFPKIMT